MRSADVSVFPFQCIRSGYINRWPIKFPVLFPYVHCNFICLVLRQAQMCLFHRALSDATLPFSTSDTFISLSTMKGMAECCCGIKSQNLRRNCFVVLPEIFGQWKQHYRRLLDGIEIVAAAFGYSTCVACHFFRFLHFLVHYVWWSKLYWWGSLVFDITLSEITVPFLLFVFSSCSAVHLHRAKRG